MNEGSRKMKKVTEADVEAKVQELIAKYVGKARKMAILDFTDKNKQVKVLTTTISSIGVTYFGATAFVKTDKYGRQNVSAFDVAAGSVKTNAQQLQRLIELDGMLDFDIREAQAGLQVRHKEDMDDFYGETDQVETNWVDAAIYTDEDLKAAVMKTAK